MIESLNKNIFLSINGFVGRSALLDKLSPLIAEYLPFLFIAVLAYIWFRPAKEKRHIVLYAVYSAILGLIFNQTITLFYFHARPFMDGIGKTLIGHAPETSFPSDHSTFMLSIAFYLLIHKKLRTIGMILTVFGVIGGICRVFCGIHYPLDIAGSIIFSLMSALIIFSIEKRLRVLNEFFINTADVITTWMPIQKLWKFFVHNRIRLTTILVLLLAVEDILEGVRPHDLDSFRDPWGIAGLSLVLMGLFLRSWAAGTIHKNEKLANEGPYAITRHPLYLGSFLMFIGFATIIGDDENMWFVLIIFLLMYFPAIQKEEQKLREEFRKEWLTYTERTSIFFPKKIPANVKSNWSLDRWLKNREYRCFASSLIILTVLEMIHEFQLFFI